MMTEEILYARLKEALRDAIARHHLDERSISLKSRGLTPEEAIGRTARTDYPILNGREVMLQARFGEALGQAFTSAPVDFEGSLADVLELDTTHDPQAAGMLVATLNAVLRAVGEISNTVHCRDDGPELCAERYAALVRERFGTPRIALVGFQPALLARLSDDRRDTRGTSGGITGDAEVRPETVRCNGVAQYEIRRGPERPPSCQDWKRPPSQAAFVFVAGRPAVVC